MFSKYSSKLANEVLNNIRTNKEYLDKHLVSLTTDNVVYEATLVDDKDGDIIKATIYFMIFSETGDIHVDVNGVRASYASIEYDDEVLSMLWNRRKEAVVENPLPPELFVKDYKSLNLN